MMDQADKSYMYSAIPSWKPLNSLWIHPAGGARDTFVLLLPLLTWHTGCAEV